MGVFKDMLREKEEGLKVEGTNLDRLQQREARQGFIERNANRELAATAERLAASPVPQMSIGDLKRDAYENPYVRKATLKDLTVNSFKRGFDNSRSGREQFKALSGAKNKADAYVLSMARNPNYRFKTDNWLAKAISGAAEQLGQQYYQATAPETLAYTGTAVGSALAANNRSKKNLSPLSAVSVPLAFKAGQVLGSSQINYEIEAGNAYQEMVENGVDKKLASKIALGVGGVNAALEALQVDDLVKSWKVLNRVNSESVAAKKLVKYIAGRVGNVANETLQETLQEGTTIAGAQLASARQNGKMQYDSEEIKNRLLDTAASSATTFGLLGFGGDAVNYGMNRGINKSADKYSRHRTVQSMNDIAGGINGLVGSEVVQPLSAKATDADITKQRENIEYWQEQIVNKYAGKQTKTDTAQNTASGGESTVHSNARQKQESAGAAGQAQYDRWGKALGENGQKAYRANIKQDTDIESYSQAFARYYDMGAANVPFDKVETAMQDNTYGDALSADQKYAAYTSGVNDAAASLEKEKGAVKFVKYYTDNAGVVENEHVRGMSDEEIGAIDRLAKAVGAQVVFTDSIDRGRVNGFIENGKINIARDAENPYAAVAAHEVTHRMQETAPEEYRAYRDFVVSQKPDAVEMYRSRLAEKGYYLSDEQVMDELAADYTGKILRDADSINGFIDRAQNGTLDTKRSVAENMSIAEKLWQSLCDFIKRVKSAFRGDKKAQDKESRRVYGKDMAELERAEQLLGEAYKTAEARTRAAENGRNVKAESGKVNLGNGVRYSVKSFAEAVDETLNKNVYDRNHVYVSETTEIMKMAGFSDKPILMTRGHLRDIHHEKTVSENKYHGLSEKTINKLPEMLEHPAIIFDSLSDKNSDAVCMLSEVTDNDGLPILIAVRPDGMGRYNNVTVESNFVLSMYGKNGAQRLLDTLAQNSDRIVFADKKRIQDMLKAARLQLPAELSHLEFNTIIHKSNNIVNSLRDNKIGADSQKNDGVADKSVASVSKSTPIVDRNKSQYWPQSIGLQAPRLADTNTDTYSIEQKNNSVNSLHDNNKKGNSRDGEQSNLNTITQGVPYADSIAQKNNSVNTRYTQNEQNNTQKFSVKQSFYDDYDKWAANGYKGIRTLTVGRTSEVLKSIGIKDNKITWDTGKIIKIKNKHKMSDRIIKQVPDIIEKPIIVMRSLQLQSRITLAGEVYDANNKPVIAVLELEPLNKNGNIILDEIKIASAYGKDNIQSFINRSEILYTDVNKKRIDNWLTQNGLQLPVGQTNYQSSYSISQKNNSVNTQYTQNERNNTQKFSVKGTEDILRQNETLKKYTLKLRDRIDRMKNGDYTHFVEKNISRAARDILDGTDFIYDRKVFAEKLRGLANDTQAIVRGKMTFDEFRRKVGLLARDVIEEGTHNDSVEYQDTKELRDYLRTTAITLSESERADMGDEYTAIRRETFGRLRLKNDGGTDIGTVYRELSALYPEFFNDETETNAPAQLRQIRDVLAQLRQLHENPFDGYMDEATGWLSNVIIDRIYSEGFASGRNTAKVTVDTGELRKDAVLTLQNIMESERKWKEREYSKMRRELYEKEARYYSRIKKNYDRKEAALDEKESRISERRDKSLRIKQIRLHTERISRALTDPSQKFSVPEFLRQPVARLLSYIDLTTDKTGTVRREKLADLASVYALINQRRSDEKLVWDKNLQEEMFEAAERLEELGLKDARIADLPVDVLETVRRMIMSVETELRGYNRAFRMGQNQTIDVLGEQVCDDITGSKKKNYRSNKVKAVEWGRGMLDYSMLNPWDFFHQLGPTAEKLFDSLREGMNQNTDRLDEAVKYMQKIREKYNISEKDLYGKSAKLYKFKTADASEIVLNRGQMISLYCLAQQQASLEHMLKGGICIDKQERSLFETFAGETKKDDKRKLSLTTEDDFKAIHLSPDDIGNITGKLTDDEKKFAENISKFFSTVCADWGNETSLLLYGYKRFNVAKYFPIWSAREYLEQKYGISKDSTVKNSGMTKARVRHASNPIMIANIFDVYSRHTTEMAKYSSLVPAIEDMSRVMNYKSLDGKRNTIALIKSKYGAAADKYLTKFMEDINGGIKTDIGSPMLTKLVSSYKGAKMGANVRVVIQQPLSYLRAAALIDGKYLSGAYSKKVDLETMYRYAPIARWKDWGFFEFDHGKNMNDLITDKKNLSDYTMAAAQKADQFTWKRIWAAVELETLDKHPELSQGSEAFYKACGRRFDEIIDRTQVVDSTLHRSQALRSKSDGVKAVYSFMSEPLKTYNLIRTAAIDAINGGKDEKMHFARVATVCAVSFALIAAITGAYDTWVSDDDEDEDGNKKKFTDRWFEAWTGNLLGDVIGIFPGVKDVFSMMQGYSSKRMDMQLLGDFVNACKICTNEKYTEKYKLANILARGAELFGVPVMAFKKSVYDTVVKKVVGAAGDPWLDYNVAKQFYVVNSSRNRSAYDSILSDVLEKGEIQIGKKIVGDMKKCGVTDDNIHKRLLDIRSETLFGMWRDGEQEKYETAISDLMEFGIDAASIESRMKSQYNKFEKSEDFDKSAGFSVPWKQDIEQGKGEDRFDVSDLSNSQYRRYSDTYSRLEHEVVGEVKSTESNIKAEGFDYNSVLRAAYKYTSETALEEASDGKYTASDEWIGQAQEAAEMGINPVEIIKLNRLKSDKDAEGKAIKDSKKAKVVKLLDGINLTDEEYRYLYNTVAGYKK